MTKSKWIRLIYGIILSISLAVAGLCLIGACICIYQSGDQPFSREAVSVYFSQISVPVYLALALTLVGFILNFALPADKTKKKIDKDYAATLRRLWEKRDISFCGPTLLKDITTLQKRRVLHTYITIGLLAVFSLLFLGYATNPGNFPSEDITGAMVRGSIAMLICLTIPFGYAVFTAYYCRSNIKKEIELVKTIAVSQKTAVPETKDRIVVLRWALLIVVVAIAAYGYFAGGTNDVLTKAVNICTECVGLG